MAVAQHVSDDRKGREADSPQQIPAPGWKDVLLRTYKEFNDDRVTMIAAAVTYFLLLSLFPTLTAFVSIYGLFTDPATVAEHVQMLSSIVPEGGMQIINEQLTRLTSTGGTALSFALVISIVLALWSASSGVKTMFEAMNIAYDERESRNFFVLNATALLFTLGGIVGAIVMIGAAVLMPPILQALGLGAGFEWLIRIGTYVLLAVGLLLGLAALYRFGPSRQQPRWRWITPGAILAAIAVIVLSLLFSWYAANFGNFDKTYGSLGGLIGMLTWIWISVTAVLIGAELNSEAEKQTKKDSTVGSDAPMGRRDANAADTVAGDADHGQDGDDHRDKSPEWREGYKAALSRYRPQRSHSLGAMAAALPVSLALSALRSKRRQ
jgi:membrane protein